MTLLQMSIYGAIFIVAVIALRALTGRRLPRRTFKALWIIAMARLVLPFSLSRIFAISPTANPPADAVGDAAGSGIASGIAAISNGITNITDRITDFANNISSFTVTVLHGQGGAPGVSGAGVESVTSQLPAASAQVTEAAAQVTEAATQVTEAAAQVTEAATDATAKVTEAVQGAVTQVTEAVQHATAQVTEALQGIITGAPQGGMTAQGSAAGSGAQYTLHVPIFQILLCVGAILLAVYFLSSYLRFRREFSASVPVTSDTLTEWQRENPLRRAVEIRTLAGLSTPLTYGILHPVVLLPAGTEHADRTSLRHVLSHEYAHIRALDAVLKFIAAAVLCLHWFNPLVWVMYALLSRDMELACDERAVRDMSDTERRDFAMTLIHLEERRSGFAAVVSYFSKNSTEERIKAIMKFKKKSVLAVTLAVFIVIAGGLTAFAMRPGAADDAPDIPDMSLYESGEPEGLPLSVFVDILKGNAPFMYVEDGAAEEVYVTDLPALFDPDDPDMKVDCFKLVDMDRDGEDELVLIVQSVFTTESDIFVNDKSASVIMHRMDDKVYGYKVDTGSYSIPEMIFFPNQKGIYTYAERPNPETGLAEFGICRIAEFTETGYSVDKIAYAAGEIPEDHYWPDYDTFFVDQRPVTEDEFYEIYRGETDTDLYIWDNARWYGLDDEDIEAVYATMCSPTKKISDVLRGDAQFVHSTSNGAESLYISDVPALFDPDDPQMKIRDFTFLNLDSIGIYEAVLKVCGDAEDTGGYLILYKIGNEIYGTVEDFKHFMDLKADGTYNYEHVYSDGKPWSDVASIFYFTENRSIIKTMIEMIYTNVDGHIEEIVYFKNDNITDPKTYEEYLSELEKQKAKPDAIWYEFTAKNIAAMFPAPQGNTDVTKPAGTEAETSNVPTDKPEANPLSVFVDILRGDAPFMFVADGAAEEVYVTDLPALFDPDDPNMEISRFKLVDMDRDGEDELVLVVESEILYGDCVIVGEKNGYAVLHRMEDTVYGYKIYERSPLGFPDSHCYPDPHGIFSFYDEPEDKTEEVKSGVCSITEFTETGYTLDMFTYKSGYYHKNRVYFDTFVVDHMPATEEEYNVAERRLPCLFYSRWYNFDDEDIESMYATMCAPTKHIGDVVRGDAPFVYDSDDGEKSMYISEVPSIFDSSDPYKKIQNFTVLDLDGDGKDEVVIQISGGAGDMIGCVMLRKIGNKIYGSGLDYQSHELMNLKTDGTYERTHTYESGYTTYSIVDILAFDENTYLAFNLLQSVDKFDGDISYYINDNEVSPEDFARELAKQKAKQDATWYEFTAKNIDVAFPAPQGNTNVTKPAGTEAETSNAPTDKPEANPLGVFADILRGDASFMYVQDGAAEEMYITDLPALFDPDDPNMEVSRFVLTDMDSDGEDDLVLGVESITLIRQSISKISENSACVVLHRIGDTIYGYKMDYIMRNPFYPTPQGIFSFHDSPEDMPSKKRVGICRITEFTETGYTVDKFTYKIGYDIKFNTFVVNHEPATEEEYNAAIEADQYTIAGWKSLTPENIDAVFSANPADKTDTDVSDGTTDHIDDRDAFTKTLLNDEEKQQEYIAQMRPLVYFTFGGLTDTREIYTESEGIMLYIGATEKDCIYRFTFSPTTGDRSLSNSITILIDGSFNIIDCSFDGEYNFDGIDIDALRALTNEQIEAYTLEQLNLICPGAQDLLFRSIYIENIDGEYCLHINVWYDTEEDPISREESIYLYF